MLVTAIRISFKKSNVYIQGIHTHAQPLDKWLRVETDPQGSWSWWKYSKWNVKIICLPF